jgi:hypothetical protein
MGILGRRRASRPVELNIDGMELLRRQLARPDAALRLLAEEARSSLLRPKTRLLVR